MTKILNIGAGEKRYKDATHNVDMMPGEGIDTVMNLSVFPWVFESNSVDGIHASHILEHFFDYEAFLKECYRILKPGGFLRICVPHCTNMSSNGALGHYRTYSWDTLDNFLCTKGVLDKYLFRDMQFKTIYSKINWLCERSYGFKNRDFNDWFRTIVLFVPERVINFLISLWPRFFQRFWWVLVGGASEVVWYGEKV